VRQDSHAPACFEHGPVAEGDDLRCPAFFDDEESCGTYLVFEPFASRQEALGVLPIEVVDVR
jgi:hypothetical protein